MNGWESHQQAAAIAGIDLQELLNVLLLAKGKQEQAIGTVIMAVGESPRTESGHNVLQCTAASLDSIERATEMITTAMAELTRYASGF